MALIAHDFIPTRAYRLLTGALLSLALAIPGGSHAAVSAAPAHVSGTGVSIAFGQELGNIRPFRVTISGNGSVKLVGPIHLTGPSQAVSKDAIAAFVTLAQAEGFRTLPSFTACPGVLPDIAARYISVNTRAWQHRVSVRGTCVDGLNQVFAVLMNATHASF